MENEPKRSVRGMGVPFLLIGLLIGGAIGWVAGSSSSPAGSGPDREALKAELAEDLERRGFLVPEGALEPPGQTLATLVVVEDDGLVVDVASDASEDPGTYQVRRMTVRVTAATRIVEEAFKDQETFEAESVAWEAAIAAADGETELPGPPVPLIERSIALSDLRAGDELRILTEDDLAGARVTADAVILVNRPSDEADAGEPEIPEDAPLEP